MNWFTNVKRSLDGDLIENAPLASMTTMGVGGPARWLAKPRSRSDIAKLTQIAKSEGIDIVILGGGSNVIVSDRGLNAIVLKLDSGVFSDIIEKSSEQMLIAGAGARLSKIVAIAEDAGLSGLEPLSGIPGTVGAALRMNSGGKYGEIGSKVEWVDVINKGDTIRLSQADAGFGYRTSNLGDMIVIGCGLKLAMSEPEKVRARGREIFDAKKSSQPLAARSAGCVFQNPANDAAGRLIEVAGMKGARCGGASVSIQHANFIINNGTATATEVMTLIQRVHRSVFEQFGIKLELEVKPWGTWEIAA